MSPPFTVQELSGASLDESLLDELGKLRIRVFRQYPYLYGGDELYEREYLRRYREAENSLVVLVIDAAGSLVGATTCLPMTEEGPEFRQAFEQQGTDVAEIFYFGESVLLEKWRGRGIGKLFFDRRESHARKLGYRITAFCAVDRPRDHPLRPPAYRPLDGFWRQRGYEKQEGIQARFSWRELGKTVETEQTLTFWTRCWDPSPSRS